MHSMMLFPQRLCGVVMANDGDLRSGSRSSDLGPLDIKRCSPSFHFNLKMTLRG